MLEFHTVIAYYDFVQIMINIRHYDGNYVLCLERENDIYYIFSEGFYRSEINSANYQHPDFGRQSSGQSCKSYCFKVVCVCELADFMMLPGIVSLILVPTQPPFLPSRILL